MQKMSAPTRSLPGSKRSNEDTTALVSPVAGLVADRRSGRAGRAGHAADHLALYGAHSLVYLDRGAGALHVHLDGHARGHDRRTRSNAFRGRYLAGPGAPVERAAAHRLAYLRARVRAGVRLVGHRGHGRGVGPAVRERRVAHVDDFHCLARRGSHLGAISGGALCREPVRPAARQSNMTGIALSAASAAGILFGGFFLLIVLRVPVAFALGLSCLPILLIEPRLSPMTLFNETFKAYNSFILLAVPFFLLTANLMNVGGITDRLVRLSRTMVGHFPGSLAQINVVLSVFFAGISGSSTADAASQSKIFIDAQVQEGYGLSFSIAITAVSAVLAGRPPPPHPVVVLWGVAST